MHVSVKRLEEKRAEGIAANSQRVRELAVEEESAHAELHARTPPATAQGG